MDNATDATFLTGIEQGANSGCMNALGILAPTILQDACAIHDCIYVPEN